jgi:hypothetical protein
MPEVESPSDDDLLAPVDVVVVEFPDGQLTAPGFDRLLELVDRNVIRILDVEFVSKDEAGVEVVAVSDLPARPDLDLTAWTGSSSGLLDADDIALVADEIAEGSIAVVVLFENVWVLDLVANWPGARLVLDGGVAVDDLIAALDATEPT